MSTSERRATCTGPTICGAAPGLQWQPNTGVSVEWAGVRRVHIDMACDLQRPPRSAAGIPGFVQSRCRSLWLLWASHGPKKLGPAALWSTTGWGHRSWLDEGRSRDWGLSQARVEVSTGGVRYRLLLDEGFCSSETRKAHLGRLWEVRQLLLGLLLGHDVPAASGGSQFSWFAAT